MQCTYWRIIHPRLPTHPKPRVMSFVHVYHQCSRGGGLVCVTHQYFAFIRVYILTRNAFLKQVSEAHSITSCAMGEHKVRSALNMGAKSQVYQVSKNNSANLGHITRLPWDVKSTPFKRDRLIRTSYDYLPSTDNGHLIVVTRLVQDRYVGFRHVHRTLLNVVRKQGPCIIDSSKRDTVASYAQSPKSKSNLS